MEKAYFIIASSISVYEKNYPNMTLIPKNILPDLPFLLHEL